MTVIVLGGGAAYGGGAAGPGKEDGTLTQRVEPEQTHMQVKFPVCCPLPTKKKAANMQDNENVFAPQTWSDPWTRGCTWVACHGKSDLEGTPARRRNPDALSGVCTCVSEEKTGLSFWLANS